MIYWRMTIKETNRFHNFVDELFFMLILEDRLENFTRRKTIETYFMTAELVNEFDLVLEIEGDLNDQNTLIFMIAKPGYFACC